MIINKTDTSELLVNYLNRTRENEAKSIERLASGERILSASDDPAGLAMANAFEAQTRAMMKQISNRQDEISLIQTAEGALSSTTDAVQRIRELSVQAANGTLTDADRSTIQEEITQLKQHIDATANNTEYNTKKLLDGSLNISLQNSKSLEIPSMTSTALGLDNVDVSTQQQASDAIAYADNAIQTVTSERNSLGAVSNGIASEVEGLKVQLLDSLQAQSRIVDVDMAREIVNLTTQKIKSQSEIRVFRMDIERRGTLLELVG